MKDENDNKVWNDQIVCAFACDIYVVEANCLVILKCALGTVRSEIER